MALNARQEKFAQLIALGLLTQSEAFKQAGFQAKDAYQGGSRLVRIPQIALRIETLRSKAETQATSKLSISRDIILQELLHLALTRKDRAEMVQLKAIELLCRMQGYNEPERIAHQHQHLHVDASLMTQLREGYASLGTAKLLQEGAGGGGIAEAEGRGEREKGTGQAAPQGDTPENIHTPPA